MLYCRLYDTVSFCVSRHEREKGNDRHRIVRGKKKEEKGTRPKNREKEKGIDEKRAVK